MTQIICIKEVYTDNSQYLNHCNVEEALSYPVIRLFTKGKVYGVRVIGDEWRAKDDDGDIESISYNHIVFNQSDTELKEWFYEHFEIV